MPWPDPQTASTDPTPPLHCGLGHSDRLIWIAAVDDGIIKPSRVWWNQTCGTPPDWVAEILDPRKRAWVTDNYCKRPDVMAEIGETLFAVEIKPFASYVALGQAVMYATLATLRTDPHRYVRPLIVTDEADPDILPVLERVPMGMIRVGRQIAARPRYPT